MKLQAIGTQYTAEHARPADLIAADDVTYANALTAWIALAKPVYRDADQIARYLERLQILAQTGVSLNPRMAIDASGNTFRLSHDVPLSWPSLFADTATGTQAVKVLTASGVPVVRIVARDLGLLGNTLRVTVSAATSLQASRFKLTLTCGAVVEVQDELDVSEGRARVGEWPDTLLVASVTKVGSGRPDDVSSAAFTGAAGG